MTASERSLNVQGSSTSGKTRAKKAFAEDGHSKCPEKKTNFLTKFEEVKKKNSRKLDRCKARLQVLQNEANIKSKPLFPSISSLLVRMKENQK